ncbi:hypothetical protein P3J6_120814 [Pseudoalteromonas sp. 3J6]|nr:hypothetical protein P3J6_120814 [Pseudoalteromonas sp. 3J6]
MLGVKLYYVGWVECSETQQKSVSNFFEWCFIDYKVPRADIVSVVLSGEK